MVINNDFWRGRNVFLTGHTGFIGSWMCLWLQSMGANVTGYALKPPSQPNLFDVADIEKDMISHINDIVDSECLNSIVDEIQPDVIIHLAAQPLVRQSYDEPVDTYVTNVMGTVNLLNSARLLKSKASIIVFTTDKCYNNREWHWGYRESDELGGYDPYSSSKACAELVTAAYRNSYLSDKCVSVATVRAGNVIGGGDWAKDRLIPDAIRSFSSGESLFIRRPNAIRPWQHVLEPIQGCLMLSERLYTNGEEYARAWNFGPPDSSAKSVGKIASMLVEQWGSGTVEMASQESGPHEAKILKLDSSDALATLGWSPRWSIEQSLAETIKWYKANAGSENMKAFTLDQINRYVEAREDD